MCGILFTNDFTVTEKLFKKSLGMLDHRGPDARGYLAHKNYKLGHTRLKILDLDNRSNQPFRSQDNRYLMIFNGEIYNFKELAKKHNITQKTTGDTEVLIELYAKLGPKMLELINGMFALVILDTKTDCIFIARDRLGIKPLYIATSGEKLTAASELASLVELTGKTQFDELGLRQYRKLRTFFNSRTAYCGLKMFPAGHYMLNGSIKKYWHLPQGGQPAPDDEELRELIKSAVDYRCISDVPVGSYLSGGLDSTIVAGLASKPHTWTIGFKDNNEFEWGRLAAKKLNTIHSEVIIDAEKFLSLSKFMISKRLEPLSVPNEVLLYRMTQQVKTENTVILSGEGADELFFGYDRIFRWAAENEWDIRKFSEMYSYGSNDDLEIVEDAVSPFLGYGKAIDIVAAFFQVSHLHGLLRRLDNATMLCSVEARVPFVDHRLIERLAGVTINYRMQDGVVKAPLKRIFSDLTGPEIMNREKVGFPVPLHSIPFKKTSGETAMDAWLRFNLTELNRYTDDICCLCEQV